MSPELQAALDDVVAYCETESRAAATVSQKPGCPWCGCTAGDAPEHPDPATLCRLHEAEYEGLSLAELDRRDEQQLSEYLDTL